MTHEVTNGPDETRALERLSPTDRIALLVELAAQPDGVVVTCAGDSMAPTFVRGQSVRVRAHRKPRVGDVVLFSTAAGDTFELHRIVLRLPGQRWFAHLGDAVGSRKVSYARTDRIIGIADERVRRVRPAAARRPAATVFAALGATRRGLRRLWRRR